MYDSDKSRKDNGLENTWYFIDKWWRVHYRSFWLDSLFIVVVVNLGLMLETFLFDVFDIFWICFAFNHIFLRLLRILDIFLNFIFGNDFAGGVGSFPKEGSRDWIGVLMSSCFGYCNYYHDLRSNKMNVFCVDYALRMCRHCKEAHSLHRRFQIYKYSYQDVFRHAELQKYFDCSKIQVLISLSQDSNDFIVRVSWLIF